MNAPQTWTQVLLLLAARRAQITANGPAADLLRAEYVKLYHLIERAAEAAAPFRFESTGDPRRDEAIRALAMAIATCERDAAHWKAQSELENLPSNAVAHRIGRWREAERLAGQLRKQLQRRLPQEGVQGRECMAG